MDKDQISIQVGDIIRDVLDLPNLEIDPTTTAENVEGWDSFNHINIVVAIEAHFHLKIHTAEVEELKNVGELVDLVDQKLNGRKPS